MTTLDDAAARKLDARDAKLYRELMADPVMMAIKECLAAALEYAAKTKKKESP